MSKSSEIPNDIYNSKLKYDKLLKYLKSFHIKPNERLKLEGFNQKNVGKYYCRNKANMKYINKLTLHFDNIRISYINRIKRLQYFKQILFYTDKDLADIEKNDDRDEINSIMRQVGKNLSDKSLTYFKQEFKVIWKTLFPVKDEKGRLNEDETPWVVKHLKKNEDPSRKRKREDYLEIDEYLNVIDALSDDKRIQLFCALIYESLGRPQELLYRKIKDVHLEENYGWIDISSHGKEGIGILRCVDSYSYLIEYLNNHPQRNNPEAWLFYIKKAGRYEQMKPHSINKKLRETCKKIGLNKPITCYSFKRNGVTHLRLRGEADKDIQSRARWKTTEQLHTYDISDQKIAFRAELVRKGIIKPESEAEKIDAPTTKPCAFCNTINPLNNKICSSCKRLLWREDIENEEKKKQERIERLEQQLKSISITIAKRFKNKPGAVHSEIIKRKKA